MTSVHLLHLTAKLVEFWMCVFGRLAMEMANTISISSAIKVHTLVLVILYMKSRDASRESVDDVLKLRK
jgi:hypothetical protein